MVIGVGGMRLRLGDEVDASRDVVSLEEDGMMLGMEEEEDARRCATGS